MHYNFVRNIDIRRTPVSGYHDIYTSEMQTEKMKFEEKSEDEKREMKQQIKQQNQGMGRVGHHEL